jgi:hypothetical protein
MDLLPLGLLADRTRAGSLIALALGSVATFGMALIVTYQLQGVALFAAGTGAALVPFAFTTAFGAAFIGPRLMRVLPMPVLVMLGLAAAGMGLVLISVGVSVGELWNTPERQHRT